MIPGFEHVGSPFRIIYPGYPADMPAFQILNDLVSIVIRSDAFTRSETKTDFTRNDWIICRGESKIFLPFGWPGFLSFPRIRMSCISDTFCIYWFFPQRSQIVCPVHAGYQWDFLNIK